MQIDFDEKTSTLTIRVSINPRSTQPSSTGKTFVLGSDRAKHDLPGGEATVAVNIYRPTKAKKGK